MSVCIVSVSLREGKGVYCSRMIKDLFYFFSFSFSFSPAKFFDQYNVCIQRKICYISNHIMMYKLLTKPL
uniref:Uncharacterized protein n=1 Tax=Rhizophora mucronata TaxID=61149 RepID=A0A2P2NFX1_RHIMU